MSVIEVDGITKDYGGGKGVFDIHFTVEKGEVLGFLGPNGAGKTTTIRQLMGFIRPDRGAARIGGKDCFAQADEIERSLGYLPGEIAFMEDMTGREFLRFIAGMKGMKDMGRAEELTAYFELDPSGRVKKMSKGMKQKVAIVCAFMQRPDILILDEPTSGLDPLMQNKFTDLILEEKKRGVTILMSSHMFEEVERTCDRAAIIKDGRIAALEKMDHLRMNKRRVFEIRFAQEEDAERFAGEYPAAVRKGDIVTIRLAGAVDALVKSVSRYPIRDMDIRSQRLEELFMQYYGEEGEAACSA